MTIAITGERAAEARTDATEILFVCSDLNVGGTERHLAGLAVALVRLGWRISVYSLAGDGPLRAELESGGVTVILPPLNRPRNPAAWPKRLAALTFAVPHLAFAMLKRRPAIAHFFLPEAYLVGAPIARGLRIPVKIMSRRSLNLYQTNEFVRRFERRLHRSMNAVLGNARAVVRQLAEEGVPLRRLGLIYNGIDGRTLAASAGERAAARAALGLTPATLTLAIVANLIPYKGHADLIEALALARPDMPADWRLLVVGRDDGIQGTLEKQAERAGLAGHITFLGARRDVPALLAASDIGLLVSHEEGFSNAVLEGMALGLPMIVTDVGGNAEAVQDNETGLVVPPRDPASLAQAIVALANDPDRRSALGAAGKQRVLELFDFAECVDKYERLYRALLSGKPPQQVEGVAVDALR